MTRGGGKPAFEPRRMPDRLDERHQLSERVAAYVREAIMVGDLRAPEFIRTERLADQLGVSATPVREALMILHSEGVVRWEPRRGFRVQSITARDVEDLFEVQAFIAGELAARAAQLLSAEDVARLRATHAELERAHAAGDTDRTERLNHEIHRTINRAGGTGRLTTLLNLTVQYVPRHYYGRVDGWAHASAHDHEDVFAALEAGDADAARAAMTAHAKHIGRLLVEHLHRVHAFDGDTEQSVS
ncbi:GntR family transcriptional regulator [Actinomycetospora lutea]|uniref:GntR family transcriptional regulator n=1 Tax=Actinomycetospora lutea TaxID=663604 RepID=UPI002367258D|nr:GntR family transcriptional regulator [Actinomycetospora lutea]MDD7941256.1 GntR family transcriptional regulator [Actinomycetospora lutea]